MDNKVISIYSSYLAKTFEIPFDEKYGVAEGDKVVFKDSEDKEDLGIISGFGGFSGDEERFLKSSLILRKATANDLQRFENYLDQSKNAVEAIGGLVKKHGLDMQVFRAAYSFDGARLLFMFTADERIDFRELVKDLAKTFQKQIYLRQVGPRDKAKIVGGYGKCGRELCCKSFLSKLESINMEMVRVQSLESKGSSKLSGVCGKLLCCLRYEVEAYRDLKSLLPDISSVVKLKSGKTGKVIALDILNKKVKLYVEVDQDTLVAEAADIEKVLKAAEGVREYEDVKELLDDNKVN